MMKKDDKPGYDPAFRDDMQAMRDEKQRIQDSNTDRLKQAMAEADKNPPVPPVETPIEAPKEEEE